jgi:hypothetical protein
VGEQVDQLVEQRQSYLDVELELEELELEELELEELELVVVESPCFQ